MNRIMVTETQHGIHQETFAIHVAHHTKLTASLRV